MGRPIRMFEPDAIYFVTNRTLQRRPLMRPSAEVNAAIGGILAEGVVRYDVHIYGLVFLSNHYHVIIKAPAGLLSAFVQFINNNLARHLGKLCNWSGKFWHRRFSAEPILDQEALLGRMKYIFMHGVKEALVRSHKKWPGLTAWPEMCEGRERRFAWPGCATKSQPGLPLNFTRLPGFDTHSRLEYAKAMRLLCVEAGDEALNARDSMPSGRKRGFKAASS